MILIGLPVARIPLNLNIDAQRAKTPGSKALLDENHFSGNDLSGISAICIGYTGAYKIMSPHLATIDIAYDSFT